MLISESSTSLTNFFEGLGHSIDELSVHDAVAGMIDWYERSRVDDAAPADEDGDMLLFQWGTSDWGDGRWFKFDMTRQMIESGNSGDEGFWQVSLTLHYAPTPEADALGAGDEWCHEPSQTAAFNEMIRRSAAFAVASAQTPDHRSLRFGPAG